MRITLPLTPKVASRPRVTKGHAYLEKAYKDWLDDAVTLLRLIKVKRKLVTLENPVAVALDLHPDRIEIAITDGWPDARGKFRGDIDNYAKAALDAIQKSGLIKNDRQVVYLVVTMKGEQ